MRCHLDDRFNIENKAVFPMLCTRSRQTLNVQPRHTARTLTTCLEHCVMRVRRELQQCESTRGWWSQVLWMWKAAKGSVDAGECKGDAAELAGAKRRSHKKLRGSESQIILSYIYGGDSLTYGDPKRKGCRSHGKCLL